MKQKKVFEIKGTFFERDEKPFTKLVLAENEKYAREKTLAIIGSKHGTKRRKISIKEIREVKKHDEKEKKA